MCGLHIFTLHGILSTLMLEMNNLSFALSQILYTVCMSRQVITQTPLLRPLGHKCKKLWNRCLGLARGLFSITLVGYNATLFRLTQVLLFEAVCKVFAKLSELETLNLCFTTLL